MPNHAYTPTAFPGEIYYGQCWVPVDDTSLLDLHLLLAARPPLQQCRAHQVRRRLQRARRGRRRLHAAAQSRQRLPDRPQGAEDTTPSPASTGVSEQDAAIQDSMGPIQDRTREHLGPTDVGVVEFRKLLMGAARALGNRRRNPRRRKTAEPLRRARRRLGRRARQGSRRGHDRALRPSAAAMSAASTDWATDAEPGRQRIPDPQRHRHADGRAAAPLLDAGAARRRNCRSATVRRRRSGSWARTCWPSATPTAGSASSSRTARIAAPISTMAATKSAACAAPSMAGSSTSTATASTCRPRRRSRPTRTRSSCLPIRCANGAT